MNSNYTFFLSDKFQLFESFASPVQSSLFGNNWNIRIEPIVSRELNMVDLVDEVRA